MAYNKSGYRPIGCCAIGHDRAGEYREDGTTPAHRDPVRPTPGSAMNSKRGDEITSQIHTIVELASYEPDRAAQQLASMLAEYSSGTVTAALTEVSADSIKHLRAHLPQGMPPASLKEPLRHTGASSPTDGDPESSVVKQSTSGCPESR